MKLYGEKITIIFVEGFDCSGKSTMCNKLKEIKGIPVYKTFSQRKTDRNYDMKIEKEIGLKRRIDADLYISDFISQMNKEISYISDRSILSYMFYEKEDKLMFKWWNDNLKKIKGEKILIFCKTDYNTQKFLLEKRYKKEIDKKTIKEFVKKSNNFLKFVKRYWKYELKVINPMNYI